jgi:DNA-binding IclR family transcriptional regulator
MSPPPAPEGPRAVLFRLAKLRSGYYTAPMRVLGRKLAAFTPHSLTDRAAIEKRLRHVRASFYEQAVDEVRLGINALSAPVFRDEDEFIGIIAIIGTSAEIGAPPARSLRATLHRVAGSLSAVLNCRIYYRRGFVK